MVKKIKPDRMMPKLMYLLRFHGRLTINSIHNYTSFGKATIRNVLENMADNGLVKKEGKRPTFYELSSESDHWLGWDTKAF